ncbi:MULTISPECIES: GntR family transcriptional regulator [unclassified Halomonas]|uniref:GntR family transcriptional regulator n=1 Tax=Halomonas sp. H10-59 TaxID=2950874 RepID=A0AAU7KW43_9GAMM|nr:MULTISPECIES: GntR family transcriptional regulator [unclassified Halomonas]KJZ14555.1 hypothetical protein TW86_09930 [Halomonas sp. S2151]MAR72499.1 GntR family transcriptional regulator [Halomonas sp.]MBR9877968.1 GntR family transcriptional regulator [Gammaproteobacteria bacterium]MCO7217345.1 GntR family transcriptional regulator [Halomonas sp. OfavH-34-E]|tara:strand:- start:5202 stop:5861 length:660 start_codon:yes stop_codon:yes gene_type:complete
MASPTRTTEHIRQQLEDRILRGSYPPGHRLNERDLAAEFAVSRTPVREVIRMLTSEGLVEHRANQGAFVRRNSLKDILDMFEMLALLESSAARLAARQSTADDIPPLLQAAQETIDTAAITAERYTSANRAFHEAIYRLAANETLAGQITDIRRKIEPYRGHIHRIAGMRSMSAEEHLEIVSAIADKREGAAADVMFHHLDMQRAEFSGFVFSLTKALA